MDNSKKKKIKIGKIEVIRDACIGAASCVALAQKTFELDEEAKAIILDKKGNSDEDILEAAKSCPTDAIIVWDDEGNQLWPEKK
jgi:ferredoxin